MGLKNTKCYRMYGANETNIVIRLCVTPWTVAHQELIPWTVHGITSPGKNTGVGCHFLFQANHPDPGIGSYGKASACNTGDPGSIPGLGRSSLHSHIAGSLFNDWATRKANIVIEKYKIVYLLWKDLILSWKIKHTFIMVSSISMPEYGPKRNKNRCPQNIVYIVTWALFPVIKNWKQTK